MLEPVEDFQKAIGGAILAYTEVERAQATLLSAILTIKHERANAIFYTVQSPRARNEMIQTLLRQEFKSTYERYWESCSAFLQKLAKFRNAVAHWHPAMQVFVYTKDGGILPSTEHPRNVLHNPAPGWGLKSLGLEDLPPFEKDCVAIGRELDEFSREVEARRKSPESPLPDKFRQRVAYQNQALLQRHPKPKAPPPPPQSSQA